jgi:hypothetical protein
MTPDESSASGHGDKTARRMEAAALALLEAATLEKAAAQAKISKSTLLRWQKDRAFQTFFATAKRAAFDHAITRLAGASEKAVSTLVGILDEEGTPATARVAAAKTILDKAAQALELQDLVRRLDDLEKLTDGLKGTKRS